MISFFSFLWLINIKGGSVLQQSHLQKHKKGVRLKQRQKRYDGTTKQTCKIASLKIAVIGEAHHGLSNSVVSMLHSHDKLLSAALLCSNFSCYALYHFVPVKSTAKQHLLDE